MSKGFSSPTVSRVDLKGAVTARHAGRKNALNSLSDLVTNQANAMPIIKRFLVKPFVTHAIWRA